MSHALGGQDPDTAVARVVARERGRIAIAYAGFVLIGVLSGASGVLLPAQIADYDVDKATIGVTFIAFSAGYVTSAAANGALIHRFGLRALLVLGAGVMLMAAGATGLRPGFVVFVALQVAMGFGAGALDAGLNVHLSALSGSTSLLNTLHAFFGVGALIGPVLAAALLAWPLPWNVFYLLVAAILVPFVAGLLVLHPRAATSGEEQRPRLSAALAHRAVWLAGAFLALYVGLEVSVGSWGFSYLLEERRQDVLLAGWAVSGYWLGLTLGRFVLNRVAERVGVGPVGLLAACLAGVGVSAVAIWLPPSSAAATAGLVLLGFFLGPIYPTTIAVMPRLVPAGLVATAIGILVGASDGGAAFLPWLAGALAQRWGAWSLLPFVLVLTGLLAVVWWRIAGRLATAVVEAAAVAPP